MGYIYLKITTYNIFKRKETLKKLSLENYLAIIKLKTPNVQHQKSTPSLPINLQP